MSNYRGDKRDIHEILLSDDEFPDECVDTPDIPAYLIDDRFDEISFPWLDDMKVKHFDKEIPYVSEDDDEGDGDDENEDEDEKETEPKAYDPFDEDDEDEKETKPKAYDPFDEDDEDEDKKETKPKAYDPFDEDEDEKETKPKSYDPFDNEDSNTDEPTDANFEKEIYSPPDTKESNSVSEKPQKKSSANAFNSQGAGTSYVTKKEKALFIPKKKKGSKMSPASVKGGRQVYNALPGLPVQSNPCYQPTLIYDGYLMQSDLVCLEYYEKYAYNDDYFVWTVNHYKYKSVMRQYHFFPGVLVPDMYCNYTPNFNVPPSSLHRNMHYTFTQ